ncbi:MAG TPA: diguanylate cyclase [Vicinamibacterales bacterium]|nr:diguanylate cyclase [Vicinamibacterales bacterium]
MVELGLQRDRGQRGAVDAELVTDWMRFTDSLLAVFAGSPPEAEAGDVAEFRKEIDRIRNGIPNASERRDVRTLSAAGIETCQQHLNASRKYHTERESELTELIEILQDAVKLGMGQATAFTAEMQSTTDRFGRLSKLDDIRDLKRQLAQEVTTLRQTVEDRQRRDQASYAALNQRVEILQTKLAKAEEEAALDPLTGLANRGAFDAALRRMVESASHTGVPFSLAMVDVDDFKAINDQHGHPIGDRVLVGAALLLRKGLSPADFVARYGGEEFAVLLHNTRAADAEVRLSRILATLAATCHEYEGETGVQSVRFTASSGVSEYASGDRSDELVNRADAALYEAKRSGKNRVVIRKRSRLSAFLGR